jgi:hypothetical protein
MTEQRAKDVRKAGERELELALHARRRNDGRRPVALARVLEQRRLADAGLATDRQSAAAGGRRLMEKTVDSRSLVAPSYEHPAYGRPIPAFAEMLGVSQRRSRAARRDDAAVERITFSKRLAGSMKDLARGALVRLESELPAGVRLESEMVFADATIFREQGTIVFGPEHRLHFRTLGTGHLAPSPNPGLRHGTVTWELDGGRGRFAGASGRITSNFTVTEEGEVADEHLGLIFLATSQKGAVK